jgi:RND family efflux transporter MFP subunit
VKPAASLALLTVAIGAVGCVNRGAQEQAARTKEKLSDQSIPVTTEMVKIGSFPQTVEVTGQIATGEDTQIGSPLSGRVTAIYVREGDSVSTGATVARLDQTDALTRVQQARAQVDSARSALQQAINESKAAPSRTSANIRAAEQQVRQAEQALAKIRAGSRDEDVAKAKAAVDRAQSDLKLAKTDLDRKRRLYAEGAIAKVDVENSQNRYEVAVAAYESAIQSLNLVNDPNRDEDIRIAESQLAGAREQLNVQKATRITDVNFKERIQAAQANLRSAEEGVRLAQKALADTVIRAPFSGRIVGKPVQAGTVVGPGGVVARLVNAEGVYFEAEVPESIIAKVKPGAPVTIVIEALGGAKLYGTVVAINPLASDVARLYTVRVSFPENPVQLRPGMFAKGTLELGSLQNVASIPADAVIRDGEDTWVYVANIKKAKRVKVEVLANKGGDSVVKGLNETQKLIIQGQSLLFDGADIKEKTSKNEPSTEGKGQ